MSRRRALPRLVAAYGELQVERDARRPSARLLRQGDMDASYVDLADARHVEFDYLRRMRDVVEATGAERIVHVGGGACGLARALAASGRPLRQDVVEVDAEVLEVARVHLGLRRVPGLRVRNADGRAYLARRRDGSADAVLVDAFVGARVPRHLATLAALADIARVVGAGGVVAINVVDVPPLSDARAIAAGLVATFPRVVALGAGPVVRAHRGGNVVLVAGPATLPVERLRAAAARDPSPAALLDAHELARFCSGAVPWHDA